MRGYRTIFVLGAILGLGALGSSLGRRSDEDRLLTRNTKELAATGTDLAVAEEEAMAAFVDTRGLAGLGCQYATQTVIILDNSYAIFDKELWLFKLLIKEIAIAFLGNNSMSRVGIVLATHPQVMLVNPNLPHGHDVNYIIQTVKGIQRVNIKSNITMATYTALKSMDYQNDPRRYNLLLLTAPYDGMSAQIKKSLWLFNYCTRVQRYAVGTRIARAIRQEALAAYVGCSNCANLQFVSECTPAKFLFLLKRLYPAMCQAPLAFRDATVMTFQIDGMSIDDENSEEFIAKFLEVVSQITGVPTESMEVLDVRDSQAPGGGDMHMRRLRSADSLLDLPTDTLLDLLILDSPAGMRDTPFNIASKLETDLRNDFSPVSSLFNKEMNGVPRMRKISLQGNGIFDKQARQPLTFQNLYLKSPDRQTLAELFQKN